MRKFFLGVCALLALSGVGCISRATRQLAADTEHIGEFVESHSSDPAIIQAGTDVKLNAREILIDIGTPRQQPAPYTPAQSAQLRQQAQQTREDRWNLVGGIVSFVSSPFTWTGFLGLLSTGLGFLLKKKTAVEYSMSDGIEALKNLIPVEGQAVVDKTLRDIAMEAGVYHEQKRIYRTRKILKDKAAKKKSETKADAIG